MDLLRTIIYFVVGLSFLVLVHELGHYLFAKLFNVYVFEFSIGMGPLLWQTKKGETKYSIRAFPIGGYVMMAGENFEEASQSETVEIKKDGTVVTNGGIEVEERYIEDGVEKTRTIILPKERSLNGINNFKKFLVIGAGVIFNFVLSFVLLFSLFSISGYPNHYSNNIRVNQKSLAYEAGLRNNDFVVKISGELKEGDTVIKSIPVQTYGLFLLDDTGEFVKENNSLVYKDEKDFIYFGTVVSLINPTKETNQTQCLNFTVKRSDGLHDIPVCREISDVVKYEGEFIVNKPGFEGISYTTVPISIKEAARMAFLNEVNMGSTIFQAVGSIFTNIDAVGGPIAIFQAVDAFAREGVYDFIYFLALISVNLGVINLLPIPGLDGSKLIIILGESITRKKFPPKAEAIINTIGLYLLFGLMILITLKDVIGLF